MAALARGGRALARGEAGPGGAWQTWLAAWRVPGWRRGASSAAGSSSNARHCALQQGLLDDMLHRSIDLVATVRETGDASARATLSPLDSFPLSASPLWV